MQFTMNIRRLLFVVLSCILLSSISNARVRYTDAMKGYIGTWTFTDKLGNISTYRIAVSDGWVILRYKYEEHYHDGTEWEGMANKKYTIDYTFADRKFYFKEDYPSVPTYNSKILELRQGSLVETTYQRGRNDNGEEYHRSWSVTYEPDF